MRSTGQGLAIEDLQSSDGYLALSEMRTKKSNAKTKPSALGTFEAGKRDPLLAGCGGRRGHRYLPWSLDGCSPATVVSYRSFETGAMAAEFVVSSGRRSRCTSYPVTTICAALGVVWTVVAAGFIIVAFGVGDGVILASDLGMPHLSTVAALDARVYLKVSVISL